MFHPRAVVTTPESSLVRKARAQGDQKDGYKDGKHPEYATPVKGTLINNDSFLLSDSEYGDVIPNRRLLGLPPHLRIFHENPERKKLFGGSEVSDISSDAMISFSGRQSFSRSFRRPPKTPSSASSVSSRSAVSSSGSSAVSASSVSSMLSSVEQETEVRGQRENPLLMKFALLSGRRAQ